MYLTLREVVKEELQKLLAANFIYPISYSKWVSPLLIVPKKNVKWCICVDYRELNKDTHKDHFSLPFIGQVLDMLVGKNYFSFIINSFIYHFLNYRSPLVIDDYLYFYLQVRS